ncbi:MAG: type B 50S ribosomal protein L31 [Actinomycetes bacterium]
MKPGIHPTYRYVVFQDTSSGDTMLTKSTIEATETTTWTDGQEYPLAKVEISAFTHPFFTGQMKIVDTAGRVERFERRYGRRKNVEGEGDVSADESADVDTDEADTDAADTDAVDTGAVDTDAAGPETAETASAE